MGNNQTTTIALQPNFSHLYHLTPLFLSSSPHPPTHRDNKKGAGTHNTPTNHNTLTNHIIHVQGTVGTEKLRLWGNAMGQRDPHMEMA